MAYCAASDVGALCKNLVGGASNFSTSTSPTLAQVNTWLSTGCALINTVIGVQGYDVIPTSSDAYEVAQQANAAYGAWWAERSRINARVTTDERTRADMFKKDFYDLLAVLKGMNLARLGVSQESLVYGAGISVSDKASVEGNTDRVRPRFARGMFSDPAVLTQGDVSRAKDEQERAT